jgi:hypothetical protein
MGQVKGIRLIYREKVDRPDRLAKSRDGTVPAPALEARSRRR